MSAETTQTDPGTAFQNRLQDMLARSATDLDLRGKLIASPRQTVAEFLGVELPPSCRIDVIENKADETIVLPEPINPGGEISERELEAVAGGCTPLTVAGAYLGVAAAGAAAVASILYVVNKYESICGND